MKVSNKVFVLTGRERGIGRQPVLALIEKGAKVDAVDINIGNLQETEDLIIKNSSTQSIC